MLAKIIPKIPRVTCYYCKEVEEASHSTVYGASVGIKACGQCKLADVGK